MAIRAIIVGLILSISTAQATSTVDVDGISQRDSETVLTQLSSSPLNPHIQLIVSETEKLEKETSIPKVIQRAFDLIAASATPYKGKLPTDIILLEKNLLTKSLYQLIKYLRSNKALEKDRLSDFIKFRADAVKTEEYDYITYLTTVLLGVYEHHSHPTPFKMDKISLIADKFPAWLKDKLTQDSAWEHVENYSQHVYTTEMSDALSQIDDPAKVYEIATRLGEHLKSTVDFSPFPSTLLASEDSVSVSRAKETLTALIRLEKYRIVEVQHGPLTTTDPTAMDYYTPTATNRKSQAVLISLVSAIQNSLYNARATAEDLLTLLRYQKNSRHLSAPVKSEIEKLFADRTIHALINDGLVEQVQKSALAIILVQKAAIDQESQKQCLVRCDLPVLSLTQESSHKTFAMRYFGSSGAGLQCGFFSLGFPNRQYPIEQILDNLEEPKVYLLADKVSSESGEIASVMTKYLADDQETASSKRYLELYAKRQDKDPKAPETQAQFKREYQALARAIKEKETDIDGEFDQLKQEKGLPLRVPVTDDGTIASQFSALRQPFEYRKWAEQTQITKLVYPLDDFQKFIEKELHKKFLAGELEFDPNPNWKSEVFITYAKIIAVLNNYDIYCWVSGRTFSMLQLQKEAWVTSPIYATPGNQLVLINFISGGQNAKRIDILNLGGGHFEKFVSAGDYPRLARSIRHKTAYRLPNTAS